MAEDMSQPYNEATLHVSWRGAITKQCDEIKDGLLKHHEKWGTSIFRPVTILSAVSAEDALRIRIDDRIKKLQKAETKDQERELVDDLIGYLVNFRAYMSVHNPDVWRDFE